MSKNTSNPAVTREGILKALHVCALRAPRASRETLQHLLSPTPKEIVCINLTSLWDVLHRTNIMPESFGLPKQGPTALVQNPYLTPDRQVFDQQLQALLDERLIVLRTGGQSAKRYALTLNGLKAAEAIVLPTAEPVQMGLRSRPSTGMSEPVKDNWKKLGDGNYQLTAANARAFKDLTNIFAEGGHTPIIDFAHQTFIFSAEEMKRAFPRVLPTLNQNPEQQQGGQQL